MARRLIPLLVLLLSPRTGAAQQAPDLAGRYVACFQGADSSRPACGTLTLSPTPVCGAVLDGYYSVLFSALAITDTTDIGRPRNETHFTWEQSPVGTLHLTRTRFVADSLLLGQTRCGESRVSDFEAWGRAAGDSIAGAWGRYDHCAGVDTLGTFVLRRMGR